MKIEEAKELSEILKAYSEGKIIQREDLDGWRDISMTYLKHFIKNFDKYVFRIKPEKKLVPFTFEDVIPHKGKWIKSKNNGNLFKILAVGKNGVGIKSREYTYFELLDSFTFEDGTSCGKYIEE
jgi:hypothetical protein